MTTTSRLLAAVASLAVAAALAAACPGPAVAGDAPSSAPIRAFVECVVAREDAFVHEAVDVRLRVGWDAAFFREHAIPLFVRDFDLPVDVHASWIREIAGARSLHRLVVVRDPPRPPIRFALDGTEAVGIPQPDVAVDGRTFRVLEISRRVEFTQPGEVVLEAPTLRFSTTSRFDDDLATGRAAVDRQDEVVRGTPRTLRVRPLPETGRPAEFVDAVGRFRLLADADRREVEAGATVRVTLTIAGDGNLETLTVPRLAERDAARGLHVLGTTDDRDPSSRAIAIDVAVGAAATQIPPIALAYFDPAVADYRVARTDAIPLVVRGGRESSTTAAAATDASAGTPRGDERPAGPALGSGIFVALTAFVVAAVVLVFGMVAARRRRRARVDGDRDVAARTALATLRERIGGSPAVDVGALLVDFLATRLGVSTAAVLEPDLARRLEAAGAPATLASHATTVVSRGVAARYGGAAGPTSEEVVAVAADVDAALRAAASGRSSPR